MSRHTWVAAASGPAVRQPWRPRLTQPVHKHHLVGLYRPYRPDRAIEQGGGGRAGGGAIDLAGALPLAAEGCIGGRRCSSHCSQWGAAFRLDTLVLHDRPLVADGNCNKAVPAGDHVLLVCVSVPHRGARRANKYNSVQACHTGDQGGHTSTAHQLYLLASLNRSGKTLPAMCCCQCGRSRSVRHRFCLRKETGRQAI